MSHVSRVISRVDWGLLRKQKENLTRLSLKDCRDDDLIDGIIHMIDAIQDAAVEDGIATYVQVFGGSNEIQT